MRLDSRPFCEVEGATCHVSNCRMEDELLKVPLSTLGPLTEYCVATLQRTPAGMDDATGRAVWDNRQ